MSGKFIIRHGEKTQAIGDESLGLEAVFRVKLRIVSAMSLFCPPLLAANTRRPSTAVKLPRQLGVSPDQVTPPCTHFSNSAEHKRLGSDRNHLEVGQGDSNRKRLANCDNTNRPPWRHRQSPSARASRPSPWPKPSSSSPRSSPSSPRRHSPSTA